MEYLTVEEPDCLTFGYHHKIYMANLPETEEKGFSFRSLTENPAIFKGYIGIEYVVNILHGQPAPNRYECTLCHIVANEYEMEHHVKTTFHRVEYLKRHFPLTWKKCRRVKEPNRSKLVEQVAKEVESYHGRSLPLDVEKSLYDKKGEEIMMKVGTFLHASEQNGPTAREILRNQDIKKILRKKRINTKKLEKNQF